MAEVKYKADRIFDGYRLVEGQVLVSDEDGNILDLVPEQDAGSGVNVYSGLLTPGFINCHCHLELSHMKGLIPEGTGLVDFVFRVVSERHHAEGEIFTAIEKAEDEMLRSGIVATGDICNNTLTIAQKARRRMKYYNFIEASGWLPNLSQSRFDRAKALYEAFVSSSINAESTIVPHAPYSVSRELWERIQPFFENRVVTVHNQETAFENEFFLYGTGDFQRMYHMMQIDNSHHQPSGKTSLQSIFSHLTPASNIILVHNTFIREEDIEFVEAWKSGKAASSVYFCLCVNANLYIEKTLPPLSLLRSRGCTLVLGTDSLASNHSLSIADEMLAIRNHYPGLQLEEILQWATINGAKALQMESTLGSFEKGKKPGIVLLDERTLKAKRLD